MAKQGLYVVDIPELSQIWRPLHQYKWSVWEERETIKYPHQPGFMKALSNGQVFAVAKNGGTKLERAQYAVPSIVTVVSTALPEKPELLSGKVEINFPASTTARAEDFFQDGYLYIKDHTGKGLNFPVAGNDAISGTTAGTITVTIDGEIFVDLDKTSDVTLVSSPFRNLEQGVAASSFGGIPPDEVSPDAYFWIQRQGPAVAIANAAVVAGGALTPAADGELATATVGEPIVAYALEAGSANDLIMVNLTG